MVFLPPKLLIVGANLGGWLYGFALFEIVSPLPQPFQIFARDFPPPDRKGTEDKGSRDHKRAAGTDIVKTSGTASAAHEQGPLDCRPIWAVSVALFDCGKLDGLCFRQMVRAGFSIAAFCGPPLYPIGVDHSCKVRIPAQIWTPQHPGTPKERRQIRRALPWAACVKV